MNKEQDNKKTDADIHTTEKSESINNIKFKPSKWNLSELIKNENEIDNILAEANKKVNEFCSYRNKLNSKTSAKVIENLLKLDDEIDLELSKVHAYASLKFSEDTSNQSTLKLLQQLKNFNTELNNKTMFFSLWFKSLPDKIANNIIKNIKNNDYKYLLRHARKTKKYVLSEKEEKIVNIKDSNGVSALNTLYNIITNAFEFKLKIDGKEKTLTASELTTYVRHQKAQIREAAYKELLRVYRKNSLVLSEIYKNIVSDWVHEAKLRGYKSSIEVRNIGNELSDDAVKALINSCRKNKKIINNYFKVKAKLLGMEKLSRYHLYAPVKLKEQEISYNDAVLMVLEVFNNFSPNFEKSAKKIIIKEHIDSEIRKHKRSGAFCMYPSPEITPYILLNYDNKLRDVSTLAHELGHGIHGILASHHTPSTFHAPLPLAETASIFSEMLLSEELLSQLTDKNSKISLLVTKLDDIYATIIRQIYFVIFELEVHEKISHGLSLDDIRNIYFNTLKEQFGNAVIIPEEFKDEWLYIPHIFHTPFYCYAYSFGNLLVLSLWQQYKREGKNFNVKLEKVLSYGGSKEPDKILKEIGINVSDEKFWDQGFKVIDNMVKELENMI